jgi:hypothetical protein
LASDVGIGDVEIVWLDVEPGDETTTGTLTVHPPDGDPYEVPVTAGTPTDGVVRLTADPITYDRPNRWVLHWQVSGTGQSAEDVEVYVVASPLAGGPVWTPGRTRVANYVPHRTLARDTETHELTFNSQTLPDGVQVDRLIADAVAWITGRLGDIAEALHDDAAVCAAIWAAAAVERGYPAEQDEQSLQRARDLQALAERMRDDLAVANQNPTDPGAILMPVYAFPAPVDWGDALL